MGTNVDVYQRAEGRYRLMPQILSALRDFANPFSILTKGTLILRDLRAAPAGGAVATGSACRSRSASSTRSCGARSSPARPAHAGASTRCAA